MPFALTRESQRLQTCLSKWVAYLEQGTVRSHLPPPCSWGEYLEFRTQRFARTTQRVCGFRCLALKLTALFQMVNVTAAILRARVRRAIRWRISLATSASCKILEQ